MKLALISLSKDTPDDLGPIGFLPLFDGLVVDQQIQAVRHAGAEKIVLISPTMKSAVLQYADKLQGQGVDVEIVRSGRDLIQFTAPENEIVFVGDGILPSTDLLATVFASKDELVLVTPESEHMSGFERIDQNERWLGIAKLHASRLSAFIDLPEDWDVGSALLRGAVQSECSRETIDESDFSSGVLSNLSNEADVFRYSQRQLATGKKRRGNFLERFFAWPLTRVILPRLWKVPDVYKYLGWMASFSAILAGCVALLELPVTASIALLMTSTMLLYVRKSIKTYSGGNIGTDITTLATYTVAVATMLVMIVQHSIPVSLSANLVIFILGLGLARLAHQNIGLSKWDLIKPGSGLFLTILLVGTIFGSIMSGIYAAALLSLAYLLLKQFDRTYS